MTLTATTEAIGLQLTCQQRDLLAGLKAVEHIIPTNQVMPVLANILLIAEGDQLRLTATNLDLAMQTTVPAAVAVAGAVTLPGRALAELVGTLPAAEVSLRLAAERPLARLHCERSHTQLHGIAADEFPVLPSVPAEASCTVPSATLRTCLGAVLFAAARDSSRPTLVGVLLRLREGQLTCTAADGYRLAQRGRTIVDAPPEPLALIVPAKACAELLRLLGDTDEPVHLGATPKGQHVVFRTRRGELLARLIEGEFPRVEQLFAGPWRSRALVNADALRQATRAAAILVAGEGAPSVSLSMRLSNDALAPGSVTVATQASAIGEHASELDAAVEGEPVSLLLGARYLQDALGALDTAQIAIETAGPTQPCILRPVGDDAPHVQVVMPMEPRGRAGS